MILSFLTRDAGQRLRLQRDRVGYNNVIFNGGMILTEETEVLGEKHYTVWVVVG
jgi:hypothetical protein